MSYDPHIHINKKSKTWKRYIPKKAIQPKRTYIYSNNDLEHVFQQISDTGIDLTNDYHDWYRRACGPVEKFGANGKDYFHLVSQNSAKYDAKNAMTFTKQF